MKIRTKIRNIALSIAGLALVSIFALNCSDSLRIFNEIYVEAVEEENSGGNSTPDTSVTEVSAETSVPDKLTETTSPDESNETSVTESSEVTTVTNESEETTESDETEEETEEEIVLLADLDRVTINSAEDLINYSNDYLVSPDVYQNLDVYIAITSGDLSSLSGFSSIGTSAYPFAAEFKIISSSDITLNKPLFAYIMDSAQILDSRGPPATMTLARSSSAASALFAENVIHDTNATSPAEWKVNIGRYTDSAGEKAHSFSGVIGTMEEGAAVRLSVNNGMTTAISIESSSNAGFACGKMKSGSSLTVSVSGTTEYNVTSEGYAGGLAGYAENAVISFESSANVSGNISGGSGTGGVFGYYRNTKENNSFDISNYNVNCVLNGENSGGIFGCLENGGSMTICQSGSSLISPRRTASEMHNYGGLIGTYLSDNTYNSLTIKDISVTIDKTGSAENYGGFVGKISDDSYIRFENSSVIAGGCGTDVTNFGGIVGYTDKAFIDAENVTVNTDGEYMGGGIAGNMASGVLRLGGTTDLSGSKAAKGGQIVGSRGDRTLIYAQNGWKLIRSSEPSGFDDIGGWGSVLRLGPSLGESEVFNVDETAHTVTVKGASTSVNSLADFVKLALNIQMNNGTASEGTLIFGDTSNNCSVLINSDITLGSNIDLTGTGLTGLTRDDGKSADGINENAVYTKTFNGNGHTITLAAGEPYGYRGNDSDPITADDTTDGNGCIHRHYFNALFARTGDGATFHNVTVNGIVNVSYKDNARYYLGGLSGIHTKGNITAENVTVRARLNLAGTGGDYAFSGGIAGNIAEKADPVITIRNCVISPEISYTQNNCKFICGGALGEISNTPVFTVTAENVELGASVTNKSTIQNKKIGGFIGNISNSKDASGIRTISIKNMTIDGAGIISETGGALLGEAWNNTEVTIGSETENGISVNNSSVTQNGTGSFAGLVTAATGYWKVYDINIGSITVNGSSASSYGMLVNKGVNEDYGKKFALYLELAAENAYKITNANMSGLSQSAVYDDIIATCKDKIENDTLLQNGNCAVISVHTSGSSLIMDGASCNTYQNQTSVKKANPNTRYYYNLDVMRAKDSSALTSSEKLMLWSVNKYAYDNIKQYFPDMFDSSIPAGSYDMTGYSYYPIDMPSAVTIEGGSSFTFCNDKIENGENGTGNSDNMARTTLDEASQHYLMHCGLFINASSNINTGASITFSGCIGSDSDHSGALLCGTFRGSSDTPVKTVLDGIILDGIRVNGDTSASGYAPLLINRIDSFTELSLSNVSTSDSYKTNGVSIAATSLIGDVGNTDGTSSDIKLTFSGLALDGRKTALPDSAANSALDTAYNTDRSVFSKAVLLNSFKFKTGSNCSGTYNFTYDEDWNEDSTPKHNVTYGSEISDSAEYNGLQEKYLKSDTYTDPTRPDPDSEYTFRTCFLPYVAAEYNTSNNFHEIKVNQSVQAALDTGCGTYNDPYIISYGKQLELLDKVLSGNLGAGEDGTVINYQKDNYKVWCADKNSHEILIWNSGTSLFVSENGSVSVSLSDMQNELSTAYFKLSEDIAITSADFLGIGKKVPFKGVICGNNKTIENSSANPLIFQSTGAVVKDLTLKITTDFSGQFSAAASTKYETDESGTTAFYGGLIGIVNGGDNIIDNVSVSFTNAGTINIKTGSYYGNKAVGGYIGVVRYGGVIFRNMDSVSSELREGITSSSNSMFKSTGDFKDNSGKILLYCNPIIGRVIDGYAVTEAGLFNGSEDNVTMHNGTKNYSIADIDKNADRIAFSSFEYPAGKSINSGTVYIKDAQQLFLLGCISMSGGGSASSDGKYPDTYSYGKGQMVRHADYSEVGTDNTADFDIAVTDSFLQDNVPYIIYRYTDRNVRGANNANIEYPAKSITNDGFVFNIELTRGTYDMPDGFRGIGTLSSTASNLTMFINGIKGNDSVIELNMNFNVYKRDYDRYYMSGVNSNNSYNVGLGLFNTLVQNKSDLTPTDYLNDTSGKYTISDLVISGNVNHEVYESESKNSGYNNSSYHSVAGGLAGAAIKSNLMIDNVRMSGLNVNARYVTGGLIGSVIGEKNNYRVYIKRFCNDQGASVEAVSAGGGYVSGGLIGYLKNVELEIDGKTDDDTNGSFTFGEISSKAAGSWGNNVGTGGLIGTIYDNKSDVQTTVLIQNIDIKGNSVISKATGNTAFVGSVIGCCGDDANGNNRIESTKLININVTDVDVNKDSSDNLISYNGGVIGVVKKYAYKTELNNVHMVSTAPDTHVIKGNYQAGGLVGLLSTELTLDNCLVENYTLRAVGKVSTVEGIGGFVGKSEFQNDVIIKNSMVSNCVLMTIDSKPAGGFLGAVETGARVKGYNIVIDNVQITDKDGNKLTSPIFGDIAGQIGDNSELKLVGMCMKKYENGMHIGKEIGKDKGTAYVIYADYMGKCLDTDTANKEASTVNRNNIVADMGSFPYVTVNPKKVIDSSAADPQFLTGDGVDRTAVDAILSDIGKVNGYNNAASEYTDKFSLYEESKLSTFNEKTGASIPDDIPVLVINDSNYRNVTEMLNSYIHILTNDVTVSNYAEADSSICNVDILPLRLNEESGVFESEEDFAKTLVMNDGYFKMTDMDYDSNYKQFTLMDIQYYDPSDSDKIAYHLYIPVYVEKMLDFDFRAAALSGTTYNTDYYTDGHPVLENYGTPVTAHITYSYKRTAEEWQNVINSGENLLSSYGKSVLLKGDKDLPGDTKLVLVDRNNYSKAYYSTIGEAFSASDKKLDFGKFSASDSTQFVPVTFCDLLNRSADISVSADTNGTLVKCGAADTANATVKIGGEYYRKKTDSDTDTSSLYSAQLTPKAGMTDSETGFLKVVEDYYISFFTNEDNSAPVRNITICCSTRLDDANMTPSHLDNDKSKESMVHMILGNLYDQTFTFKTTGGEVINENNRALTAELKTIISLKPDNAAEVKPYLNDDSIHLYHGFIIEAIRKDAEGVEKGVKGAPRVTGTYKIGASEYPVNITNTDAVITLTGSTADNPKDIKEYLINSSSVAISCDDLTITYSDEESIIAQFPERKNQDETYGVTLSANSVLAYLPDNIGQSNMSEKQNDGNGKSYYRENIAAASLSYNIPVNSPNEMVKLGINGRDTNEKITAAGYYNVLNIPDAAFNKAKTVKFILSLYQKNNDGSYEPVPIDKYLTNITLYDKNGTAKAHSANNGSYEFLFDKENELNYEAGTFEIISSYSVITGAELESADGLYSNYKVQLTAMLLDQNGDPIENSGCSDYIIYTNAKIYSHMLPS